MDDGNLAPSAIATGPECVMAEGDDEAQILQRNTVETGAVPFLSKPWVEFIDSGSNKEYTPRARVMGDVGDL